MKWNVLDLGPAPVEGPERWNGDDRVERVFRIENPAPSGRRMGSRLLGLGFDGLRVAVMARSRGTVGPFISMNPWTTVAARVLGFSKVATVGLYAVEGSRSWRILRAVIGHRPVVTLSQYEAERWRAAGGRARAVRYGATFSTISPGRETVAGDQRPLRVFIGGSSDRDGSAIEELVRQVRRRSDIRLVIAIGGRDEGDDGAVRRVGALDPIEFSRLITESDIVYLPLADNGRAAGHMVLVEALQRGKPVVANWVAGMDEYFDGNHVVQADGDLLEQLVRVSRGFRGRSEVLEDYWRIHHSSEAFGKRILDALDEMTEERTR